jgi:small GTP-binding protein
LARTEEALRALLAQPAAWAGMLARPPAPDEVGRALADRGLWWLLHPPRVAIVGVPNVGKSTLANQLFAQERSIVADLPGTTRDWVGEVANVDGLAVTLVDTPGVRDTVDEIERRAIERSGRVVAGADLVLVVLDASRPAAQQRALPQAHPDAIVVLNKYDLLPSAPDASSAFLRDAGWTGAHVRTTATTGAGISDLRRAVRQRFDLTDAPIDRPRWWTHRQRDVLAALLRHPPAAHASSGS